MVVARRAAHTLLVWEAPGITVVLPEGQLSSRQRVFTRCGFSGMGNEHKVAVGAVSLMSNFHMLGVRPGPVGSGWGTQSPASPRGHHFAPCLPRGTGDGQSYGTC